LTIIFKTGDIKCFASVGNYTSYSRYRKSIRKRTNKKYKDYPNFIAYGDEYSKQILDSGKVIDIWK